MKKKHKNLLPWLDYFNMLRRHEEQGFLHVKAQEHEAYVTQPALLVLAGVDETEVKQGDIMRDGMRMMRRCTALVRHLRTYAAYLAAHAKGLSTFDPRVAYDPTQPLPKIPTGPLMDYLRQPFALNVVQPDEPHDPLYTMPTRSGTHTITRPFNLKQFKDGFWEAITAQYNIDVPDVKKNHLTLLYENLNNIWVRRGQKK